MFFLMLNIGIVVVQWAVLPPCSVRVLGSNPNLSHCLLSCCACSLCLWVSSWISCFHPTYQEHASKALINCLFYECINVCLHGALRWTGIPFRVHLLPHLPQCSWNALRIHRNSDQDKVLTESELTLRGKFVFHLG